MYKPPPDPHHRGEMFLDALCALAQPVETQVALFPTYVPPADEMCLTFGETWMAGQPVLTKDPASAPIVRAALIILDKFREMQREPPEVWQASSLESHRLWIEIREIARSALIEVGMWPSTPGFGWMQFVPGGHNPQA